MFDVVSCPASSNRPAMPMSSSSVSSLPCSRTSMPRMSSPGCCRARSTNELMYSRPAADQLQPLGHRNGQVELAGAAALEVVAVVIGHAEQLADHQRRDRQREARHQIRWRPGLFHRVQLCVDDLDDARLQPLHPPDRELGREHAPQPLMLGRVEAEQIAGPRAGLLLLGDRRRAGHDETRWPGVGEPFVVGQHVLDVLVPGDEVDLSCRTRW